MAWQSRSVPTFYCLSGGVTPAEGSVVGRHDTALTASTAVERQQGDVHERATHVTA